MIDPQPLDDGNTKHGPTHTPKVTSQHGGMFQPTTLCGQCSTPWILIFAWLSAWCREVSRWLVSSQINKETCSPTFFLWMTYKVVNSWSMRFQRWESMRVWRDISYRGNCFQTSRCFAACSPISKKYMRSCRSWTNFDSSPLRAIARAQIPAPGYVSSNIRSSQMTVDKFLPRPSLVPFSASKTRKISGINNNGRHRKLAAYCATNSPSTGTTSPRAVTTSPHCTSRNNKQVFRVFASLAGPSVKRSQHSAANLPPHRRTLSVECVRSQCPWFQQSLPQVFPPIATNWGVPSWVPRAYVSPPLAGWSSPVKKPLQGESPRAALKGMVCCNVFVHTWECPDHSGLETVAFCI